MKESSRILKYFLACGLCFSLFSQTMPTEISLVVVEGEGVVNPPRQRVARDPAVRVEDENHHPVTGAAVVFTLPVSGVTGEFVNGQKTLTVVTDKDGMAAAHGLKTNDAAGKLQIYVTASYRGLRTRTLINQFTMASAGKDGARKGGGGHSKWVILAVLGAAAAAGGVVAATHGGGSSGNNTVNPPPVAPAAITITAGTGTVGGPH